MWGEWIEATLSGSTLGETTRARQVAVECAQMRDKMVILGASPVVNVIFFALTLHRISRRVLIGGVG